MKPLAANTLLQNRYLIVHLIGRGGMGEVYLAIDQRLGSAMALKRTFFSGDPMLGSAFEREARTLARLRHPVLPKVSDHFIEDETQYLIMEHIAGDDLAKRLEISQKPFPLDWVLFWADQLLDALGYLHSQEPPVIHRDIKPQNLKLTDENSVVLLDFGLSKNTPGETPAAATTGSVIGYTPHFAPLEQIRGIGTDARSDIYSLSATLYQLLTNVVPPDVLSRADTLLSGKPDSIKPPNEINAEISQKLSDVILKGIAVSQEQRFTDARQMQKALRDAHAQIESSPLNKFDALNFGNQSRIQQISQPQFKTNVSATPPIGGNSRASLTGENFERDDRLSQPIAPSSSTQKSFGGRFLTIINLGIFLALVSITGFGWFLLRNSELVNQEKPIPTPEAATTARTPKPTFESIANKDTKADVPDESNVNLKANVENDSQTGENKPQSSIGKSGKANQPSTVKTAPKQTTRAAPPKPMPKPSAPAKATPLPRILP